MSRPHLSAYANRGVEMPLPPPGRIDVFPEGGRRRQSNYRRESAFTDTMSDAFDYFRAYAVRALCTARSMPRGRIKHLQLVAGRIYNLLNKEAAYGPNTQQLEDFRAAQILEISLDRRPDDSPSAQSRFAPASSQSARREDR